MNEVCGGRGWKDVVGWPPPKEGWGAGNDGVPPDPTLEGDPLVTKEVPAPPLPKLGDGPGEKNVVPPFVPGEATPATNFAIFKGFLQFISSFSVSPPPCWNTE